MKQAVSQVPLFNVEGGPDSDPDEGFSMLASEEEEKAKHKVQGGGERRKGAQCAQHTQPQQEGDTELEPEEVHVHVECKHGFALISGTRDDTLQPACYKEKCKEDGERWLKSE